MWLEAAYAGEMKGRRSVHGRCGSKVGDWSQ